MSMWNDERDAELKLFVAEGKSRSWIADHYVKTLNVNCTRNMVVGRVWRLGLESPTPSKAEQNLLKTIVTKKRKERAKARALQHEENRTGKTGGRLKPMAWYLLPDAQAPAPLLTATTDLTTYQCRAVCEGTSDEQPGVRVHCGLFAHDGRWCEYHHFKFLRPAYGRLR